MDLLFKLQVFVVEALKAVTHSARGTLFVHAPFNMTFCPPQEKKSKQIYCIFWILPVWNSLKSDQELSS